MYCSTNYEFNNSSCCSKHVPLSLPPSTLNIMHMRKCNGTDPPRFILRATENGAGLGTRLLMSEKWFLRPVMTFSHFVIETQLINHA